MGALAARLLKKLASLPQVSGCLPLIQAMPPFWMMSVLPRPRRSMWPNMANRAAGELGLTGGGAAPGWDLRQLGKGKGIGGEGCQEVGTLTHTPYMAPGHLQD